MLFIPLPFVVSLLLIILFVAVIKRDSETAANIPFLALILLSALQSVFSGLHWGYDVKAVMYITPVTAAFMPPLTYLGVSQLVGKNTPKQFFRLSFHLLPAIIVLLCMATRRAAIDIVLILIFIGYAAAILRLMRHGTDALRLAPFEGATSTYHAILFAAFALALSATLDTLIFLDFLWKDGALAVQVITFGNLGTLIILSIAAGVASRSHVPAEMPETPPQPKQTEELAEDKETILAVQAMMKDRHVYRDPDLNLDRLSRKMTLPSRQISAAINRATGKNVSQYVNEYRIAEACTLLAESATPVTEIMFDVGFQTKSNFNREFRRVTDMSPLEWRKKHGANGGMH
ncbi:AraC family transcriptional regulator [Thalassospira sp. TSL5-1]|uniref:helix-turn-helix domain-containing protein n=1 Tax=Thalassospira sp. TSL5-1 TaxID=1544451 RepID=UPI00093C2FCB|nr:AraC family transcriptional regulator [Thalassospira sp. TSL5-1]OKH86537.1 AraC family transcriptional regulator [Thalassospira sp. TSL5-1]